MSLSKQIFRPFGRPDRRVSAFSFCCFSATAVGLGEVDGPVTRPLCAMGGSEGS